MHHGEPGSMVPAGGGVAVVAVGLLLAGAGIFHVRRLSRAVSKGHGLLVPIETGHVVLAAGMATMFLAPRALASLPFAWLYLAAALVFLGFAAGQPRCCDAPFWSCYSLLTIESFAMAVVVASSQGWTDHLTALFVVVFGTVVAVAIGRLVITRVMPPSRFSWSSLTPATSQVVMSGAMLLMFL